jgi:hypothetical protein
MAPRNEKNTAQIPTIRIHSRGDLGSVLTAPQSRRSRFGFDGATVLRRFVLSHVL